LPDGPIFFAERDKMPGSEPSTIASWSATLVRALDAQGIEGLALARKAGIDPKVLADPEGRVPRAALTELWRLAVEATGDPCFGLTAARFAAQTTLHALGYAMLASSSLKEAFERLIRFRRMIGDVIELSLIGMEDRYRVVIDVSAPPGVPFEAVDAFSAGCVRHARQVRGDRNFHPLAVLLMRPQPPRAEAFRQTFGVAVRFGQPINAIDWDRAAFEERLPTGNAELARQNDEVAARYLSRLENASLSRRVQRALLDDLPDGPPSKQAVARKLGMSPRNLQRHLASEGASFKELLNEARVTLARNYVADGRMSVTEIAFLLGFADTSTFSRAFKRWTGKSPREYARGSPCGPG
jgi:AraC-like DNA-binding protein